MASQSSSSGEDYWPQTTEVLATFMGFGMIFQIVLTLLNEIPVAVVLARAQEY